MMGWKPQIRALLNSVEQLTILRHVALKSHSCQIHWKLSLSYACSTINFSLHTHLAGSIPPCR